ncbi:MAG: hypothetical protein R6X08_03735 [Desulfosalsimonadaceae bacterium]
MNHLQIFIVRAVLGGVLAFFLCRIFRPGAGIAMIIGLAIVLVGLSYLFEYFRKRKS